MTVIMDTCYCFSNDRTTKCVLHYVCNKAKESDDIVSIEPLPFEWMKASNYVDYDEIERTTEFFILGKGNHTFTDDEQSTTFSITVSNVVEDRKILSRTDYKFEIIKQVELKVVSTPHANSTREVINNLVKKATQFWYDFQEKIHNNNGNIIRKYVYDPDGGGYWDFMSSTEYRSEDSLFLKEGEKAKLIEYVKDFVNPDTKKDYIRYNIPYKSNILLYGVPGSGKTSTCLVVASALKTNIGIIPISRQLDDSKLIHAINNVKKNNCKIIIMEDIDCLFSDRKANDTLKNSLTLSGLLNSLDGLCRNEGIIVFLTTNDLDVIDAAMLRSMRLDYRIEYKYADEYQTKECYKYFRPNDMDNFDKFYNHIRHKNFTIANVQEFLFKHKREKDLVKYVNEMGDIIQQDKSLRMKTNNNTPPSDLYI